MRLHCGSVMSLVAVLFAAQLAWAQERAGTLSIRGDVLKPGRWAVDDLKRQFAKEIQTVKFTSGSDKKQRVGTGVPLLALIQAAEPKTEKVPKHYDLTFLVILEASDSYRVFFSLAELLPQCGHAQVWLLWEADGKLLSGNEAPFRLAVLTDEGHDRCIYGIASMTLVDGTKLATQLASGK